jgi:heterotetrameric sarcosine oxidase alpha subunit
MMRLTHKGLVDRSRHLSFRFDGREYSGFSGDTLASALLANGVHLLGRSFKYHRPRGVFTAGAEEPNALVELRRGARKEPNTRATVVELFDGLEASSQNRFPSLKWDFLAINNLFAPFLAAGFYYKTFMWPSSFWEKVYEPMIRRAAGLGFASGEPDPDRYEKSYAFCDVLIVGSGPAGLMAASIAARSGERVILVEEDFALGGRLLSENATIDGFPAIDWVGKIETELRTSSNVDVMLRTALVSVYDTNTYVALEKVSDHLALPPAGQARQRLWKIVATRVILATGSHERLIAFGGNDKPGVMQASAMRTYVNRYGVIPGRQVCLFTATDDGWQTAADLVAAGVAVVAVIDPRSVVAPSLSLTVEQSGTRIFTNSEVVATIGGSRLKAIDVNVDRRAVIRLKCDALGISGGFDPELSLTSHLGHRPVWSEQRCAFLPNELPIGMSLAGAVRGSFSLQDCLKDGARAAGGSQLAGVPRASEVCDAVAPFWRSSTSRGKAFVDFQNDVTASDVELAAREGFSSSEHLKRYTTLGMATDQGKTGGLAGQALMAALTQRSIGKIAPPIARPPAMPVAIGAYAGHHRGKHFRPTRLTAGHTWASENGAVFVETGQWLRAQWFTKAGDKNWLDSVSREAGNVRRNVGVCDVSTLGKIDIQGSDAGAFLDKVYINTFSTLPVGKARYGVMLREDGFVMDDGTVSRMADDHYFMTTTTANAGKVMQHLEFCHQVLWPNLDVQMVSVTEQWAQYAIAGPNARSVLERVVDPNVDISNEGFPFLAARSISICKGVPARLFRISFSGELAYELSVAARYGDSLIRVLMTAGSSFGLTPYGTEALSVLRIEKGHSAGNELNGQTTARDLGLGSMMSKKKDYIGRIMSERPALIDPQRPSLIGFKPVDRSRRLGSGAHVFKPDTTISPETDLGYLTSTCFSPALDHWIGLGMLSGGSKRIGERVRIYDPVRNADIEAEVCSQVFVDPEGKHLHV